MTDVLAPPGAAPTSTTPAPLPPPTRATVLQVAAQIITGLVTCAYVATIILRAHAGYNSFDEGVLATIAEALPLVPIALHIHYTSSRRSAWIALEFGVILYNIGNLVYLFHDQNLNPIPSPALSDVPYLASYVAFAIGVLLFTKSALARTTLATRLDGAVVALAVASMISLLWIDPSLIIHSQSHLAATIVNFLYPACDLALIVILIASLAPMRYRPDLPTLCLQVGFLAFTIGDIIYMNRLASNTYVQGTLLDATWPIGLCLLALAAAPRPNRRLSARRDVPSTGLNIITLVFGTLAVAVDVISLIGHGDLVTSLLALAALLAVILRMGLAQHEAHLTQNVSYRDARTDDLTTLMNRRGFIEEGRTAIENVPLSPSPSHLAVILIDLDGFKEVNDSLGHEYGDSLLQVVARRFATVLSPYGTIARLGGDEFAATLLTNDKEAPLRAAKVLSEALADPISLDGLVVHVDASIGVSLYPEHGQTHSALLRAADVAMYESKRSRVPVVVYDHQNDPHSRARLATIELLRNAIAERTIMVSYQPILDLTSRTPVGVEALVRWPHPKRGLLSPNDFIPLAEQSGLIMPLTRTVLDIAIADCAALARSGGLSLSVNISRDDLTDPTLPIYLAQLLRTHDFDPALLVLEVTESALGPDHPRASEALANLRSLGLHTSIDDFGVGYSSLSQLLNLPADELKMDRSFVHALTTDPRATAVITATIDLAKALNIYVVAEGIENADALVAVTALGARRAQGYFISPPLEKDDLESYFTTPPLFSSSPLFS